MQLDGTGRIGTSAGDKQLHVALLLTGDMVALNGDGVRLCRGVVIIRGGTGKIGERQISLSVTETVVQKRNTLTIQGTRAA